MALLKDKTKENLEKFGVLGLSFTMPTMSVKWVDKEEIQNGDFSVDPDSLSLTSETANWISIFSGLLNNIDQDNPLKFCLQDAQGDFIKESGVLLRLFPQQIIRLKRLTGKNFEPPNEYSFERKKGNALRQVPAYLFYKDVNVDEDKEGYVAAGNKLDFKGELLFFDEQGYILHPLYVASLLKALLKIYPALLDIDILSQVQSDDGSDVDFTQLDNLINITTDSTKTVRLVKPDGMPHKGEHINGISVVNVESGLFSIDDYTNTNTENSLQGQLSREDGDPSGDFNQREADRFFMGNVTYCRMMDKVLFIKCPEISVGTGSSDEEDNTVETVNLKHDFFTVKVVETKKYLIGNPNPEFKGTLLEPSPEIRLHQKVSALPTGNHIMGGLNHIFSGTKDKKLCAAVAFDENLPLPENQSEVLWPDFPKIDDTTATDADTSFPSELKENIQSLSEAKFISIGQEDTVDVYVKLIGLPLGSAVRIYNRVFGDDASLKRGNGAGGICTSASSPSADSTLQGELELVLKNPLGLSLQTDPLVPGNAKLIFDLMINLQDGKKKKLFGAIELNIADDRQQNLPILSENAIATVQKKSVCKAPILRKPKASDKVFDFNSDNTITNLFGLNGDSENESENEPEDPPRLITMARRDLLAASLDGDHWKSLLGGGRSTDQLQNAEQDKGCPGSKGGKETSNVGLYTENGLLAYDIARMALRRTTNFYSRIPELTETAWREPDVPDALTEIEYSSDGRGTITGAILQNIAPFCETPELALLKLIPNEGIFDLPDRLDDWLDEKGDEWIKEFKDKVLDEIQDGIDSEIDDVANKIASYFEKTQEIINESKDIIISEIEDFYGSFEELTNRIEGWIGQFDLTNELLEIDDDLGGFKDSVETMKDQLSDTINRSLDGWTQEINDAILTADNPLLQNLAPYIQVAEEEYTNQLKTNINSSLDEALGSLDDLINQTEDWIADIGFPSEITNTINDVKNKAESIKDDISNEIIRKAEEWMNLFDSERMEGIVEDLKSKLSDKLNDLVDDLNDLKNETLHEGAGITRVYNEFKREISASCYGRRDTQWALEEAIKNARNFIYIETPGFCNTGWGDASHTVDLIKKLKNRLEDNPALKVILCMPKQPDFSDNYLKWIKNEVKDRFNAINSLNVNQVVSFHPIGFPGRYSNLEQTTVIVDDVWALVGSSSFRRRGLTFDGSSDMVFTDLQQSGGVCSSINQLRLGLLKQRLGIPQDDNSSSQALQLQDIHTTFKMIRESLVAGGLGKIERLWKGYELGITYDNSNGQSNSEENEPAGHDVTNPDGLEFNLWKAAIQASVARCSI